MIDFSLVKPQKNKSPEPVKSSGLLSLYCVVLLRSLSCFCFRAICRRISAVLFLGHRAGCTVLSLSFRTVGAVLGLNLGAFARHLRTVTHLFGAGSVGPADAGQQNHCSNQNEMFYLHGCSFQLVSGGGLVDDEIGKFVLIIFSLWTVFS